MGEWLDSQAMGDGRYVPLGLNTVAAGATIPHIAIDSHSHESRTGTPPYS